MIFNTCRSKKTSFQLYTTVKSPSSTHLGLLLLLRAFQVLQLALNVLDPIANKLDTLINIGLSLRKLLLDQHRADELENCVFVSKNVEFLRI